LKLKLKLKGEREHT